jgi:hypothetical protein
MASKIWRNLIRTAAAVCFVAGSGAQAGGVFYQSDFDPDPFSLKVVFRVDDACTRNAYVSVNGWPSSAAGCTVTLYNVTATLRHFTTVNVNGVPVVVQDDITYLDFVTPSNPYPSPEIIRGAYFANTDSDPNTPNELVGIDWVLDFLMPQIPLPYIGPEVIDNTAKLDGKYWIRFKNEPDNNDLDLIPESIALLYKETCLPKPSYLGGGCFLRYPALVPGDGGRAIVVPVDGGDPGDPLYKNLGSTAPSSFDVDGTPVFDRVDPIPEPGSLALLGGALVAGWLTRRRKAAA